MKQGKYRIFTKQYANLKRKIVFCKSEVIKLNFEIIQMRICKKIL